MLSCLITLLYLLDTVTSYLKPSKVNILGFLVEDLDIFVDLLETWDLVNSTNNNYIQPTKTSNKVLSTPRLGKSDNLSMDLVGRWARKTRNIKGRAIIQIFYLRVAG